MDEEQRGQGRCTSAAVNGARALTDTKTPQMIATPTESNLVSPPSDTVTAFDAQ